jgi:hypothetical protein
VLGPCGPWTLARAWGRLVAAEDGDNDARHGLCGAGRCGDGDNGVGRRLCGVGRRRPGMGTMTPGHLGVGRGQLAMGVS